MNIIVYVFLINAIISNEVPILTKENFSLIIGHHSLVFINFSKSWCSHCTLFREEFRKVHIRSLKAENKIPLYELSESEDEIFDFYGVTEYPTAILFYNSLPLVYKGPKFEYEMFDWIYRVQNPTET